MAARPAGARGGTTARAATGIGAVRRVVAATAKVEPGALRDTTRLVEGLGLASLDLVELAVAIEEDVLGVDVKQAVVNLAHRPQVVHLLPDHVGRIVVEAKRIAADIVK